MDEAELTDDQRAVIERYYSRAAEIVPEMTTGMSYGMHACLYRGKGVLSVIATRAGFSMFPYSGSQIEELAPRLEGFSLSKGGIRFTADHLVPDDVFVDLLALRMAEIDATLAR